MVFVILQLLVYLLILELSSHYASYVLIQIFWVLLRYFWDIRKFELLYFSASFLFFLFLYLFFLVFLWFLYSYLLTIGFFNLYLSLFLQRLTLIVLFNLNLNLSFCIFDFFYILTITLISDTFLRDRLSDVSIHELRISRTTFPWALQLLRIDATGWWHSRTWSTWSTWQSWFNLSVNLSIIFGTIEDLGPTDKFPRILAFKFI